MADCVPAYAVPKLAYVASPNKVPLAQAVDENRAHKMAQLNLIDKYSIKEESGLNIFDFFYNLKSFIGISIMRKSYNSNALSQSR